jgi:hypothetical protein
LWNTDTYTDSVAFSNTHPDSDAYGDTYTDCHTDSYTYANCHTDSYTHANRNSHGNCYTYTDINTDGNSDADCASSVANTYSDAQTYPDAQARADASSAGTLIGNLKVGTRDRNLASSPPAGFRWSGASIPCALDSGGFVRRVPIPRGLALSLGRMPDKAPLARIHAAKAALATVAAAIVLPAHASRRNSLENHRAAFSEQTS